MQMLNRHHDYSSLFIQFFQIHDIFIQVQFGRYMVHLNVDPTTAAVGVTLGMSA